MSYRVQFNSHFNLKDALQTLDYWEELGISAIYASPLLKAKKGSLHGYDVVSHEEINPEIGTEEELATFSSELKKRHMSLILDIVPNHMYIKDPENRWWADLLEKGKVSPYADFFDISWESNAKILLPFLDRQYGEALEQQTLKVIYDQGFKIQGLDFLLPTDPKTWPLILNPFLLEAEKILGHTFTISDFQQDSRLKKLFEEELKRFNGTLNQPHSFDALDNFLKAQPYRLCFWQVAKDEINFRRFFDIFEYAGLRAENEAVYQATHQKVKAWAPYIDGLRIDHIDGLKDPQEYLERLRKDFGEKTYIIVEKILTGDEKLPSNWPVQGTVGYDFLNQLNQLFVHTSLLKIYQNFTGEYEPFSQVVYHSKKEILETSLASELQLLTKRLYTIAQKYRYSQDLTFDSLKKGLLEILASFPVYRTYIRAKTVSISDHTIIDTAIKKALKRSPFHAVFQFIKKVLLLEVPEDDFVLHFQQLTGPVMAKGLEDTAFYRHFPLASLNEVGGNPERFGITVEAFHQKNLERMEFYPTTMLATSTHDTKRSEDVRSRLNVLSEMPEKWKEKLDLWHAMNRSSIVTLNDEYLLYQTLVGAWPISLSRISSYMEKAAKEAKVNTSWITPNPEYDEGLKSFIAAIYNSPFLDSLNAFVEEIKPFGFNNSLSQTLIKLTAPGIANLYQGTEDWNFTLVDPDNRQPVTYKKANSSKFFLTQKVLQFRKQHPQLFNEGIYLPLTVKGAQKDYLIAYARYTPSIAIIVLAPRFFSLHQTWENTELELPKAFPFTCFRHLFTRTIYHAFELKNLLREFPVCLLESQSL